MEDDLIIFKWYTTLICLNRRRPHFFGNERRPHFLVNKRLLGPVGPEFFLVLNVGQAEQCCKYFHIVSCLCFTVLLSGASLASVKVFSFSSNSLVGQTDIQT